MSNAANGISILQTTALQGAEVSPSVLKGTVQSVEGNIAQVSVGGRTITVQVDTPVKAGQTVFIDIAPSARVAETPGPPPPNLAGIIQNLLGELNAPNDPSHVRFVMDTLTSPTVKPYDLLTVAFSAARGLAPSSSILNGSTAILMDEIAFDAQPPRQPPGLPAQGSIANMISSAVDALGRVEADSADMGAAIKLLTSLPAPTSGPDFRPDGIFQAQSRVIAEALQIIEAQTTELLSNDGVFRIIDSAINTLTAREAISGGAFQQELTTALEVTEGGAEPSLASLVRMGTENTGTLNEINSGFENAVRTAIEVLISSDIELSGALLAQAVSDNPETAEAIATLVRAIPAQTQPETALTPSQPAFVAETAAEPVASPPQEPSSGVPIRITADTDSSAARPTLVQSGETSQPPAQESSPVPLSPTQPSQVELKPLMSQIQTQLVNEVFSRITAPATTPESITPSPESAAQPATAAEAPPPTVTEAAAGSPGFRGASTHAPQTPISSPAVLIRHFLVLTQEVGAEQAAQQVMTEISPREIQGLRDFLTVVSRQSEMPSAELNSAAAELSSSITKAQDTAITLLTRWLAFGGQGGRPDTPTPPAPVLFENILGSFLLQPEATPEASEAQRTLEAALNQLLQNFPEAAEALSGPRAETREFLRAVQEFLRAPEQSPARIFEIANRLPREAVQGAREGALRFESAVMSTRPEINTLARAHDALTSAQDKITAYRAAAASQTANGNPVFYGEFAVIDEDGVIPVRFRYSRSKDRRGKQNKKSEALIDVGLSKLGRIRSMISLENRNVAVDLHLGSQQARGYVNSRVYELGSKLRDMALLPQISVTSRRMNEEALVEGLSAPLNAHKLDIKA